MRFLNVAEFRIGVVIEKFMFDANSKTMFFSIDLVFFFELVFMLVIQEKDGIEYFVKETSSNFVS